MRSISFLAAAKGLFLIAALLLLCGATLAHAADAERPPSIVVILADDVGYSDIGCYGGEIETPQLDALAKNGLRFTQFYNTARCCPTRAALLTGLYPHQAGVGHMMADKGHDAYRGELNRRGVTIAEALAGAGYRNYMTGKWHVSRHAGPNGPIHAWPRQRGFDRFYGTIKGGGSFYDPTSLCRGNRYITPENDPQYKPETFYYTDAISDNAVKFLSDHARNHAVKPFFLYVAYTAAHWPMHALPEDIVKYKGRYDAGYDAVRKARFERMKRLGLVDAKWELSPTVGDWDRVTNREWELRCMEVYAAMIDRMDQGIAKIVAELKRQGRFDDTLIFYMQDNGGCAEGIGRQAPPADAIAPDYKPFGPDDLQPAVSPPMQTRDGRAVRTGPGVMPGPVDTYIAYGRNWANVSNTPFREYKHWVHEGGIATPLVVHWPAGIPAVRRNQLVSTPGHLIDIMATCLDVAAAEYPQEFAGQRIEPLEGTSLKPLFTGQPIQREQSIFWEHEGNRAVRDGNWKLVSRHRPRGAKWELYDMQADRTEMQDLAGEKPELVKTLAAKWQAWADRVGVLPWPVGAGDD